ncbi:hypothetical protein GQX73_g1355 [Xylaria multiplex]|uniref:Uncharacterized protein n=1 Tax=Xylaria multiplex TaxID=323545 RepID=A0A7C8MS79_9PEZI|nr:hypothetical protein GQX73_g1355 [Xylaria multiplex]
MRLINTHTLELEECLEIVPRYAILSHTWGNEEVSLQDWLAPETQHHLLSLLNTLENDDRAQRNFWEWALATHASKADADSRDRHWHSLLGPNKRLERFGFWKILKTCLQARKDGLDYLWVDTNCIDKTSSAELSEAINSMYAWYRRASICYAYLSDVLIPDPTDDAAGLETGHSGFHLQGSALDSFRQSRWFRRGWTLQELLAPRTVQFYSRNWAFIGAKTDMAPLLAEITRVDEKYLLYAQDIRSASVAQRMAAVADRTTTRPEDIAYCLLGLFNVNMPLLYGEGAMAFVRLQEEIMKVSDDHSIFAWTWIAELTGRTNMKVIAARRGSLSLGHMPNFPANRVEALLRNRVGLDIRRPTLLAPDPACFFDAGSIPVFKPRGSGIFTITNAGLSISLPILRRPGKNLNFAVIHEEQNSRNDTMTAVLIPLTPHYQYQDRWTRTCFPFAPITAVFQIHTNPVPTPETIHVCRDTQHVSFYFDAFGGTSHRFGFWVLFPQFHETDHLGFHLKDGHMLGNGVYNSYGMFANPEDTKDAQLIGGVLVFSVEATRTRTMWRKWHCKTIILLLAALVERTPDGGFAKTSYFCRLIVRQPAVVKASEYLQMFVAGVKNTLDGGAQPTNMNGGVFRQRAKGSKYFYQSPPPYASAEFLNEAPLSHAPESEITLTKMNLLPLD